MSYSYSYSSGSGGGAGGVGSSLKLGSVGGFQQVSSFSDGGAYRTSWSTGGGGGARAYSAGSLNASSGALVPVSRSRSYVQYGAGGGGGGSGVSFEANEKIEMQSLNNRLGSYITKVRALEEANRNLQIQINEASSVQVVSDDGIDWAAELAAAREALLAANLERARVEIERDSVLLEVNQWQDKISGVMEQRAILDDEMNMLRRESEELTMEKVDLEGQIEGAKGELEFLKQLHAQEVTDLKGRIAASGSIEIKSDFQAVDLNAALKAIREQYDEIAAKNRAEVEASFKGKVAEVKVQQEQSSEALTLVKTEITETRRTVTALTAELESLKAQSFAIQESIASAERDNASRLESKMEIINSIKMELGRLKSEMSSMLKQYEDLIKLKLALETEIAQYNTLLSGEETRLTDVGVESSSSASYSTGGGSSYTTKTVTKTTRY
ncbi:keratin, type I cytoskeletal 15-like [Branchiostoma floridae]|uniref:Keratin, type I cytoskeletal 15-like n=1 Tax=Branchiostoma floridae TaxID=7739 RepID=A0A9J7HMI6_BRAFL|nr:keratin, type I cytoskeletal 15-like [Branchiostoma floridae]